MLLASRLGTTIEHMGVDKMSRLRRLGVVKGTRHLKSAPNRISKAGHDDIPENPTNVAGPLEDPPALAILLPGGNIVESEFGACFVLDHVFSSSYQHGNLRLEQLQGLSASEAAGYGHDDRLADLFIEDFLFIDTETTGLTGAGTIAFMVGVAFFEKDDSGREAFVVRQYFLRDHGDEAAMLVFLSDLLTQKAGLVTFNGRSFDLPLLDTRFLLNSLDGLIGSLAEQPHIDLLPLARRLWRKRLGSCSLSSLERNLLGVQRGLDDVPGWAIPSLYMDYLRTGDARELLRVFYHNRIDMLSMVTLAAQIARQVKQPDLTDDPLDLLSLAQWQIKQGHIKIAEETLRQIIQRELPLDQYHQALHELGMLLKRDDRREEAVELWQQIAITSFEDVAAHVELAKYYEWHQVDLEKARFWTQEAVKLANQSESLAAELQSRELNHRLARLDRKIDQDLQD